MKSIYWENEYRLALILFIIGEVFRHSFFTSFPYGNVCCLAMKAVACGLAIIKLIADVFGHRLKWRGCLLIGIPAACCAFLLICGKPGVFIFLLLFSAAGHDVQWERIVRTFSYALLGSVALVLLSNLVGLIGESTLEQWRGGIIVCRYSSGFDYYYSASHYLFFALLVWVYARREKITFWELAGLSAAVIYVYLKAGTKMPFILSIVTVAISVVLKTVPYFRKYHVLYWIGSLIAYPAAALGIFLISVCLEPWSPLWLKLNSIVSGRLLLNYTGYQNFGIKLFGNDIVWLTGENYNIVDSSYLSYLYEYGVIFLVAVLCVCILMAYYGKKREDTYFAIITCIIAAYAMFDNWLLRPECNLFMFAFPYINTVIREMKSQEKELSECEKSD